jgi:hypothetical protein
VIVCSKLKNALNELEQIHSYYYKNVKKLRVLDIKDQKHKTKEDYEDGKICDSLKSLLQEYVEVGIEVSERIGKLNDSVKMTNDELIQYFKLNSIRKKKQIFNCHVEEINKKIRPLRRHHTLLVIKFNTLLNEIRFTAGIKKCDVLKRQIEILTGMVNSNKIIFDKLIQKVNLLAYPYLNKRPDGEKTQTMRNQSISNKRKSRSRKYVSNLSPIIKDLNEDANSPKEEPSRKVSANKRKSRSRKYVLNLSPIIEDLNEGANSPKEQLIFPFIKKITPRSPSSVTEILEDLKKVSNTPTHVFTNMIAASRRTRRLDPSIGTGTRSRQ